MYKSTFILILILAFSLNLLAQSGPVKAPRIIQFSGHRWWVKRAPRPTTPGYNYFGADTHNVWIDHKGQLHLKIVHRDQRWYCAEIVSKKSFGYGDYIFLIDAELEEMDPNVVFGLFTWDTQPHFNNREIDIEFSKWGKALPQQLQYVVQPYTIPHNIKQFDLKLEGSYSSHGFRWQQDQVLFRSWHGHIDSSQSQEPGIAQWRYTGNSIPPQGNEKVRVNLYLYRGKPAADRRETEVIIKQFIFIPE